MKRPEFKLSELTAISPIDGRYRSKVEKLAAWFSQYGLMRMRLKVEIEYLIKLLPRIGRKLTRKDEEELRGLWQNFSLKGAGRVKEFEQTAINDVKALEYYIRARLGTRHRKLVSFVHFGLTSDDVNVPAYGLALKEANETLIVPAIEELYGILRGFAKEQKDLAMLGRTHGQPAVPTTLGKELANYVVRIEKILQQAHGFCFEAKLNGAVGNYNALVAAYPRVDWIRFSDRFISGLGLVPNRMTTQILPYDNWLQYFSLLKLLNNVLIGFCQDMWRYISDGYLLQIPVAGEVGSSTMPQKVNPIDFENAEGNLGIANALLEFYERKLPINRLQRDLSDSTVKRTFGAALAHSLLAYQNIVAGLGKIAPNKTKTSEELGDHWEVIAEGLQTILRAEGIPDAYEKLSELTRGREVTQGALQEFIGSLKVSAATKKKLMRMSPGNYVGLAEKLVSDI